MAETRAEGSAGGGSAVDRNVLARAAAILGSFSDTRPLLSLEELSNRSRLPRSTTYRLAVGLVAEGWLEYEASGYRIGVTAFRTGRLAGRRRALRGAALRQMDVLASTTGLPITLGVLARGDVVCVGHRASPRLALAMRGGAVMPADGTALGSVLLSEQAARNRTEPRVPGVPRLARVRHRRTSGTWWCHAVAVRDSSGTAVAALSIAAQRPIVPDGRELAALDAAARRIGAAHGEADNESGRAAR